MNKEYLITGNILNIYDENEQIHKREIKPGIDIGEVLALENRKEFLADIFQEERDEYVSNFQSLLNRKNDRNLLISKYIMFSAFSSACLFPINVITGYPISNISYIVVPLIGSIIRQRNIHQKKIQHEGSSAVVVLCSSELVKVNTELKQLYDSKYDGELVRNDWVPVRDDNEYNIDFLNRVDMFSEYGERKKEMLEKAHNNLLDQYLDSIGCSEMDKSIFLALLDAEKGNNSNNHSFTENVYVKK